MAVVVQRFIDADVAGIMFTGDTCVIEASWGIGTDIVAGQFTPDFWRIRGSTIGDFRLGDQMKRTDRHGTQLVTRLVDLNERHQPCLTETQVLDLHALGQAVSRTLGGPRDIEWAIAGDTFWILQARPVTVPVPSSAPQRSPTVGGKTLSGVPASPGTASGPVRLIRGHADFATVQGGDVIVCRTTDPAWTPLFMRAAAVITETGGVLSHAAIVAREVGIPAVLAVPQATELLKPASMVTVDGTSGHATTINP